MMNIAELDQSQSKHDHIAGGARFRCLFPSPVNEDGGICVCDVEMYTLQVVVLIALISPVQAQISSSRNSTRSLGGIVDEWMGIVCQVWLSLSNG
jgi:hypothetical protein